MRSDLVADVEAGRDPFAGPPPTFAEFAERWMHGYVEVRNRPTSQAEKRSALRLHILPVFGRLRLDEISTARIDAFSGDKKADGLKPKTINNLLTILRCSLATAHEWGLLAAVPRVRWLRVAEQPYKCLKREEVERLISATRPGYWRALVTFIADTGVRFGEAAALRWADLSLDSEASCARIVRGSARGLIGPTKTGRVRTVPLTRRTRSELRSLDRRGELVFAKLDGGVARSEHTCDVLQRYCDRAGVPRVGWHGLRHTFATLLCQGGVPLRNVQELLGHTTIVMTSRYAHATPDDLRRWISQVFDGWNSSADGHLMVTKPPDGATGSKPEASTSLNDAQNPTWWSGFTWWTVPDSNRFEIVTWWRQTDSIRRNALVERRFSLARVHQIAARTIRHAQPGHQSGHQPNRREHARESGGDPTRLGH
jgi:integrase